MSTQKKVYIGLSGGVDSSVSAALLVKAGYDVTGVFIKVWQPDWITCTWKEDRLDAMRVCAKLGIPFVTLDLEAEYKTEVVDYMIAEYSAGRTPNPDVMCNKYVKFGGFYDYAMKHGADYVATGHYAQSRDGRLLVSKDVDKDQTYFLWTLTQEQLKHVLFPIGHLVKKDVREIAHKFDLITATKKDSQGLCFIGKVDMKEFLRQYITVTKGDVLSEDGKVIGAHNGALLYTIGERHGFMITAKTDHDDRYYVIAKDIAKNTITIAAKTTKATEPAADNKSIENPMTVMTTLKLRDVSWTHDVPTIGQTYEARSRYRQVCVPCVVTRIDSNTATVNFSKADRELAAGQSLVLYSGEECLGGGIIE